MNYRLVIFDFDGTLADSFRCFLEVLDEAATRYHFRKIDREQLAVVRKFDARQLMRHLGLSLWKLPRVARYVGQGMARNAGQIPMFEGASTLLRQLSKGGRVLAIVSSNLRATVQEVLGQADSKLVAYYECGASLFGKRSRLERIVRQSGCSPAECIYVGDELRDLEAARQARVAFGAVCWGYTQPATLIAAAPDHVFESPEAARQQLGTGVGAGSWRRRRPSTKCPS